MKPLTNYQRVVQYIMKIFKSVNEYYFDNELETPTITIQSSKGVLGHISVGRIWINGQEHTTRELNIGAETLWRPIEEVVATIIHECCHLYAMQNGIKDCSNNNVYHNKKFLMIAQNKGHLIVYRSDKYGYSHSVASDDTVCFCIEHGFEDIQIQRGMGLSYVPTGGGSNGGQNTTATKPTSSTRKYICECGNSFRATKDINVLCMDCSTKFIKVTP